MDHLNCTDDQFLNSFADGSWFFETFFCPDLHSNHPIIGSGCPLIHFPFFGISGFTYFVSTLPLRTGKNLV
jgi:hypothetical protein